MPDNLTSWLNGFNNLEVKESSTYDLTSVEDAVSKNDLSISTIESLVSFISLFLDFINQDEKKSHLEVYTDKELLKETGTISINIFFGQDLMTEKNLESGIGLS